MKHQTENLWIIICQVAFGNPYAPAPRSTLLFPFISAHRSFPQPHAPAACCHTSNYPNASCSSSTACNSSLRPRSISLSHSCMPQSHFGRCRAPECLSSANFFSFDFLQFCVTHDASACLFSPCTGLMPRSHSSAIFSKQSHLRQNPKPNSTSIAAHILTFIPLALLLRCPSLCICTPRPIIALTSCAGHCKSTDPRQDLCSSSEDKVSSALHRYQHTNPALHNAPIQVASAPLTPLPRFPPDLLDCSASPSEPASRLLLFFLRLCTCCTAERGVLLIAFFFATMFV